LDGIATETAEITLVGGASTTITFTLTEAAGEHSLEIEGLTDRFTVTAPQGFPSTIYIIGILIIAEGASIYARSRAGNAPYLLN